MSGLSERPGERDRGRAPEPGAGAPIHEPMLATLADRVPGGARAGVTRRSWTGTAPSRACAAARRPSGAGEGRTWPSASPGVARALERSARASERVVDGEICTLDEQGRPRFSLIQQRRGEVVYCVFDLLERLR